jgi:DNA-binding CsgD family transcriptional regulator
VKLLSYLSCFCAVEGLVLGVIALALDFRSTFNRLTAAASLAYAIWAVGMTFAYGSENLDAAEAFYRFSFLGSLFAPAFLIWLYLLLADGSAVVRRVCVVLVFAWAGFVLSDYVTSGFYYGSFHDGPWSNVGVPSEHWFLATYSPYFQALQVVAAILVWNHHARRRRSERERRQLGLLLPGLLATIVLDFSAWGLEVWAGLPNAMVISGSVLITVTFLLIARYRHLLPDRPLLERHLFDVSQESGFLLDVHGRILGVNEPALQRLNAQEAQVIGRDFAPLFDDSVLLEREWRLVSARHSLHRRVLATLEGRTVAVTLTPRFDEFHDLVGVGVLVGDLPGFDERAAAWGITPREKTVLLLAVQDAAFADIADALGISPGTVKNHLHNLCEKTGCANRVELFGRLLQHSALADPTPVA